MDIQELVIQASIAEFNDKGLKFTMDDIARRLSMSKKTIYTVFSSKEQILEAVADYIYSQIKNKEQEIINKDLDIVEKIHDVIIALPDNYKELDYRQLDTLKDKYPDTYYKVVNNIEANWDSTLNLISQGIEQGRIRPVNLNILKEIISATIEHFISSPMLSEENISYGDALEEMMNIIMKGIVADA